MAQLIRLQRECTLALVLVLPFFYTTVIAEPAQRPTEAMVVTASRTLTPELDTVGNISLLTEEDIRITAALQPHDLGVRVPGVWIGRGSGQEHLTAIRSPVLTGPGSCGAFLIMEDAIPTRPAGFCNVNQMFEVPTELARSVEVIRGPANALYGSNGLHGTVNTLLPTPGDSQTGFGLMAGSNDFWRGRFNWDSGPAENSFNAGLVLDSDSGYRDDSGYEQAKFYAKSRHEISTGLLSFNLSGSWLDQETAGFITGEDAYKDDDRFRNENPEAYRKADSLRFSTSYAPTSSGNWNNEYRFYLRNSDMEFLQHFLPNKPLEENGQTSGGLMLISHRDIADGGRLTLGIDAELAQGWLKETQESSSFLIERPAGKHYDYEVDSYMVAGYGSLNLPFGNWELQAGLRGEYLRYDYNNRMVDGNTADDGTACTDNNNDFPPGGCLYFRPADRSDDFFNVSPNLGLLYHFNDQTVSFINLVSGFRTPQATELYRLQAQQTVADIESERLDSIEVGTRRETDTLSIEAVVFYMYKSNFIFRDSAGLNVSDGKTKHYGIEANLKWQITEAFYLSVVGSFAEHTYDFARDAGLGEIIEKGNQVDTAPQILGSARAGYQYKSLLTELEYVYQDPYFMDAANTARYEGHEILNLRLLLNPTETWGINLRINNLTDVKYADRADYLSTPGVPDGIRYRYFPGRGREYYLELTWRYGGS